MPDHNKRTDHMHDHNQSHKINATQLNNPKENYKGKWIPKELEALGLSAIEQMLLATIDAYDDEETHCYASNAHLSKRMGISESRISFYITKFKRLELIKEIGYNGRFRVLKCLKYNWYKPINSKKALCVKTRSQTTRKREPYRKVDTTTLKDPPPPSSIQKPKKDKPKPKESLRSEEEDLTIESKKMALSKTGLTDKNKNRILRGYDLKQIQEAVEIFMTLEVKDDAMGLILHILNNPERYEKKQKIKTKEDTDKEKEDYRQKNKELAQKHAELYKKKMKIDPNFVRITTHKGNVDLFFYEEDFEKHLHSLLNKIDLGT